MVTRCGICGNTVHNEEYTICNDCISRSKTLDNVISFGKEWTEEITLNGFFAHYFNGYVDELEELLKEIIRNKYEQEPEKVRSIIAQYVDYDMDCFVAWLEEKWNVGK